MRYNCQARGLDTGVRFLISKFIILKAIGYLYLTLPFNEDFMLIKKIAVICLFVAVSAQYGYSQSLPVEKDFLLGKVDYTKDSSFVKASAVHSSKPVYLKKATYAAFVKMYDQGPVLSMISDPYGTGSGMLRNFLR
jgi:hypothetical protein